MQHLSKPNLSPLKKICARRHYDLPRVAQTRYRSFVPRQTALAVAEKVIRFALIFFRRLPVNGRVKSNNRFRRRQNKAA
jgi:hypothetical protein